MTGIPAGLREALTEAADSDEFRRKLIEAAHEVCPARERASKDCGNCASRVNAQLPVLLSWLADHDAEVRQQGRNEAAQSVKAECCHGDMHYGNFDPDHCPICTHLIEAARGGSDLKGNNDE